MTIAFDNSYARLPDRFFARLAPTPVAAPGLIRVNGPLAEELGLDPAALAAPEGVRWLAGNAAPEGAEPIAMAYAGHQFGQFSPQLGDGRAILLGEVVDRNGRRRDIQLKGSGPTPFSRMGDGRAALGPVLREYVVSEAMAALGIPTTRALAAVTTGEEVRRETPLPGAVLARVAASHVRVGTFQYFAARQDVEAVRALADYVIERHYPEARAAANPTRALLDGVIARQAALVARWMQVGFIHGVMNTDNMQIAGETIDYGPCAFMDGFHPGRVYSSIDHAGRYAWAAQPRVAHWNLSRLAGALLPALDPDEETAMAEAQAAIDAFPALFERAYLEGFAAKLGLAAPEADDAALIEAALSALAEKEGDFTLFFRRLADAAETGEDDAVFEAADRTEALAAWMERWRARLAREGADPEAAAARMRAVNPALIPRNHRVEEVIRAAMTGDAGPFHRLTEALARPFDPPARDADLMRPPRPDEIVAATFCGT